MVSVEDLLGLPGLEITAIERKGLWVEVGVRLASRVSCIHCGCWSLRLKDRSERRVRHLSLWSHECVLLLQSRKWLCRGCGRSFWERFPGVLPSKRATECFRRSIFYDHWDGICRKTLGQRRCIGSATVERWFLDFLNLQSKKRHPECPRILGIDEHFFTRRDGYATTFCDLGASKVFDVVLGRSESSLEAYLSRLKGTDKVKVVCIDLSQTYRSIARKHFPNARIVADRFHVIRLVGHHFLATWKLLDPTGSKSRGLLSLMRRKRCNLRSVEQAQRLDDYLESIPALKEIYWFKQNLCELLCQKACNHAKCKVLAKEFVAMIQKLQDSKLPPLVSLGQTLESWKEEIATMWRFTKNNAITEGFHNKMETLTRRAYGFRNFNNYRLRVRVMCG